MKSLRCYIVTKTDLTLAVVAFAFVLGVGYSIIRLERDIYVSSVQSTMEQALHHATDQITSEFFEFALAANKIESFLELTGGLPEKQIDRVAEDLLQRKPDVVNIALAPDLQITHTYPKKGNESTVGLEYWKIPEQYPSVAKAYRERTAIIVGPVPLIQGGTGYILRYPVFIRSSERVVDQFWGIISIAIKSNALFRGQKEHLGSMKQVNFTLKQTSSPLRPFEINSADPALFKDQPVTRQFTMLGSIWQAAAIPTQGWPIYSPMSPYLFAFTLISAIAIVAALLLLKNHANNSEQARSLLSEAIECIDEGFIAFDGNNQLVIVNQKYIDYYPKVAHLIVPGVSFDELVLKGVELGQYPDALGREQEWIEDRLARHRQPSVAFLQRTDKGRWLKVVEGKTPNGYTVGVRTDVTSEKRAQEIAEAADRDKTEFLGNVSHELRTPLTIILGRGSFLQHANKLPQSQRIHEALCTDSNSIENLKSAFAAYHKFVLEQGSGIVESAQHMLRLVEDLLDWAKFERGQLKLDVSAVQASSIAEAVVTDLQSSAEHKGLHLNYSYDGLGEVIADKVRLKQILYNVISNAIKFTDHGGVNVSVSEDSDAVVISIQDTGCGVAEHDMERIFNRFQQVDGSMTRKHSGLGLGLAIANMLTKLHGGTLSLESRVGEGSTFYLSLPRTDINTAG